MNRKAARVLLDRWGNPLNTTFENDDWNFYEGNTTDLTHGVHVYPARMIPQLATRAIQQYSKPGNLVYDPFCGSGTVLVEARAHGRNALGIDLNPLAVLLSKVKATPLDTTKLDQHWSLLRPAIHHTTRRRSPGLSKGLAYWFKPYVAQDLDKIWRVIDAHYPELGDPYGDFFRVIFSSTLRKVSSNRVNEFKRYRIEKKELKRYKPSVIEEFSATFRAAKLGMAEFSKLVNPQQETRITVADARHYIARPQADLIVTSPPYGDSQTTVAYGQFSSFSIEWMKLRQGSPLALDTALLGGNGSSGNARAQSDTLNRIVKKLEKKDDKRAEDVESFFNDFEKSLETVSRGLKKDGFAVFVTGNRVVRHMQIPMDLILSELADRWFEHDAKHPRVIHWKRLPSKVRQGRAKPVQTMTEEAVTILRRT